MLLHNKLDGNIGINIKRVGDIVSCAVFSEKAHAFSTAARAADLYNNAGIEIFV